MSIAMEPIYVLIIVEVQYWNDCIAKIIFLKCQF